MRALWIEMLKEDEKRSADWSRPVRALWIEMGQILCLSCSPNVEAREGLVD